MRGHALIPLSVAPHPDGGWTFRIEDTPAGRRLAEDLMHTTYGGAALLVVPHIAGARDALEPVGEWPDPFVGPGCASCSGRAFVAVEVEGGFGDAPCQSCDEGRALAARYGQSRRRRASGGDLRPAL
jgi:hypothetical protein